MSIDMTKVESAARMYHQFFDGLVQMNITRSEWERFDHHKREVLERLGLPMMRYHIDETGSQWADPLDFIGMDEDWMNLTSMVKMELNNAVVEWVHYHKQLGWPYFFKFASDRSNEFVASLRDYVDRHRFLYTDEDDDITSYQLDLGVRPKYRSADEDDADDQYDNVYVLEDADDDDEDLFSPEAQATLDEAFGGDDE